MLMALFCTLRSYWNWLLATIEPVRLHWSMRTPPLRVVYGSAVQVCLWADCQHCDGLIMEDGIWSYLVQMGNVPLAGARDGDWVVFEGAIKVSRASIWCLC